ncbi:MAG: hypothetical protein VXW27_06040 [Pseudomonadota bacterium]|nr:hypothetical protein [Pseudomonadota bacterium]
MKSDATIVAVVRTWLFAVTAVSGLIAGSAAFAHDGKKHTDENPHVLYGAEALLMLERGEVIAADTHLNEEGPVWYLLVRNPLTTNLWECTGTFPLSSREEAAAWRCIGGFYREHRALTEPEYPEY